jgi:hypothetical protein
VLKSSTTTDVTLSAISLPRSSLSTRNLERETRDDESNLSALVFMRVQRAGGGGEPIVAEEDPKTARLPT